MDEKHKRELYDKLMDKFDSLYADLQNFVQEIAEDLSIEELEELRNYVPNEEGKTFYDFDSCTMGLDEALDNEISNK